jgi:ATP-dependent helicase YprA (DUF1998 family)
MEAAKGNVGIYAPYFYTYIKLVENEDLKTVLQNQLKQTESFFNSISEGKYLYKYEEGKWSMKEVILHVIDTERVFAYRALAFSRKDLHTLPSMDQNIYAINSNANNRNWKDLVTEFIAVRQSTIFLFNGFSVEQLNEVGKASDYEMSVKALGYTIAGHLAHHVHTLKERYLV